MCPKITRPFTVRFCDLFSFLTGVVTRKKLVSPFKKTIATNPLNHCIESSIPPCQFSFSPWFFFSVSTYKCYFVSILDVDFTSCEWNHPMISVHRNLFHIRLSLLCSFFYTFVCFIIGWAQFLEFFFLHSLSSLFFYFFLYFVLFLDSRTKLGERVKKKTHVCFFLWNTLT